MALLLYPATRYYGITGVSALSAGVAVVDFIISAWLVDMILDTPILEYARLVGPSLACALLAAGAGKAVLMAPWGRSIYGLLAAGLVMGIIYLPLIWLADAELRRQVSTWLRMLPEMRRRPAGEVK